MSSQEILWDEPVLITRIIEILSTKCNFQKVSQVRIKSPDELKGQHIATESVYVQVQFGDHSHKNLFLKIYSNNPGHREIMKNVKVMERESCFYNEFLPSAQQFCRNYKGGEEFMDIFPACLFGDDEMILLENLVVDSGFQMLSVEQLPDLPTALCVLSNLAKFHAVTYSMIVTEGLEQFKSKWAFILDDTFSKSELMESAATSWPRLCLKMLEGVSKPGVDETIQFLKDYSTKVQGRLAQIQESSLSSKLVTFAHGDCWNNNMLFKLEPTTCKVLKQVFVDMQCTRLASPMIDICNYFYSSIKPNIRRESLKSILSHYYTEFEKVLKIFHVPCPISFEEFLIEFKRYCEHGLIMALVFQSHSGAMKEMNYEDMGNNAAEGIHAFSNHVSNWVENNPVEAGVNVEEIVLLVQEYRKLTETTEEGVWNE